MQSLIDINYIAGILPKLMTMLPITLYTAEIAAFFSFLSGILFTVIRIKKIKIIYPIVILFISFLRSTPVLIQLFVIYYGVPLLIKQIGMDINNWNQIVFAIITLVLHNGSYFSEVLRPVYLSIDKGQHDAADSIGMTGFQKLTRIIAPQMVPMVLPGAGNLLIDLIKDTSILFTIGVVDLMGKAKLIIASNYGIGKMQVLFAVAFIYWVLTILIEKCIGLLEKRNARFKFAKGIKAKA